MVSVARIAAATANGVLDLLYPPKCLVCGRMGDYPICTFCTSAFAPVAAPICDRCGSAIAPGPDVLCAECDGGAARSFGRARAAGLFQGTLRDAILRLKYGGRRRLAVPLGDFLAEYLETEPFGDDPIDALIPVALHPSRLRDRGFNQSALIAQRTSERIGIPVVDGVLRRIRRTRPQVELRESERASNVRDAFAAKPGARIEGRTVLLVDDVVTSLHTADECARVLADAGAKRVHVVGVARG